MNIKPPRNQPFKWGSWSWAMFTTYATLMFISYMLIGCASPGDRIVCFENGPCIRLTSDEVIKEKCQTDIDDHGNPMPQGARACFDPRSKRLYIKRGRENEDIYHELCHYFCSIRTPYRKECDENCDMYDKKEYRDRNMPTYGNHPGGQL